MANVKANLSRNYTTGEKRIERNVLLEKSISTFNIDVEINKSTGFRNKRYQS
jgi:hypothetical protein